MIFPFHFKRNSVSEKAVLLNNRKKTETSIPFLVSNFILKLKELTHAKFAVQLQLKSIKSLKYSLSNEKKKLMRSQNSK